MAKSRRHSLKKLLTNQQKHDILNIETRKEDGYQDFFNITQVSARAFRILQLSAERLFFLFGGAVACALLRHRAKIPL
jgi:hypothetical protein